MSEIPSSVRKVSTGAQIDAEASMI